jgi:hypothetical protein
MHIHDFYSKLTSGNEGGSLFEALRNLSLMEDLQAVLGDLTVDWPAWDGSGSGVACAAVQA